MDIPSVSQIVISGPDGIVLGVFDGERYKAGSIPFHGDPIDRDEQSVYHRVCVALEKGAIEQMLRSDQVFIPAEEVYASGYDTAGNYHWTGAHSGEHIIRKET